MLRHPGTMPWKHNPINSTLKRQQRVSKNDILLAQHRVRCLLDARSVLGSVFVCLCWGAIFQLR